MLIRHQRRPAGSTLTAPTSSTSTQAIGLQSAHNNSGFCTYHQHPHDERCKTIDYSSTGFHALVLDYSTSTLSASWHHTFSSNPLHIEIGTFVDAELGASHKPTSASNQAYLQAIRQRITDFVHEHEKTNQITWGSASWLILYVELVLDPVFWAYGKRCAGRH
jgi:hypothetical protein